MFTIIYDRNYRRPGQERKTNWTLHDLVPDVAPHRIIELHADGEEKVYLDDLMGGSINRDEAVLYGDLARTAFLNIEDPA